MHHLSPMYPPGASTSIDDYAQSGRGSRGGGGGAILKHFMGAVYKCGYV